MSLELEVLPLPNTAPRLSLSTAGTGAAVAAAVLLPAPAAAAVHAAAAADEPAVRATTAAVPATAAGGPSAAVRAARSATALCSAAAAAAAAVVAAAGAEGRGALCGGSAECTGMYGGTSRHGSTMSQSEDEAALRRLLSDSHVLSSCSSHTPSSSSSRRCSRTRVALGEYLHHRAAM